MNVIYCTDIDRTIMFSQRALHQYLPDAKVHDSISQSLVGDNREIAPSYISAQYLESLREFCNADSVFGDRRIAIAATCRTTSECKVLRYIWDFDYVICDSGAKILNKGDEVEEYTEYLHSVINGYVQSVKDSYRLVCQDDELFDLISRIRIMDDSRGVFIKLKDSVKLDDLMSSDFGNHLSEICTRCGTEYSINGRKIYLMPEGVDKGLAVKWLKSEYFDLIGDTKVISSGDTDVDVPLFEVSDEVYLMGNHTLSDAEGVRRKVESTGGKFVITLPGPEGTMQVINEVLSNIKY